MKILILGGTGAMGKHLVDLLAENGNDLTITSRKKRDAVKCNVNYIQGNAKEEEFIRKVLKNQYDIIVDFMAYTYDEFSARVDWFLNNCNQYIFISSARVYADSETAITEDSPRLLEVCTDQEYLSTNEYALAKARQENLLFERKAGSGGWTIVRPSLTYSSSRLQLGVYEKENWLYRAIHGRSIVFSEDLMEKYYNMTTGYDVARGIVSLLGKEKALGEAYHIVGNRSYQWKEYLEVYLKTLEEKLGKRPYVHMTELCTNLTIPEVKYQVLYGRYFNRHFDNSKIAEFIDVDSFKDPLYGLHDCLNEFLGNPVFNDVDWRIEALVDRAAKEKTPLREIPSMRMRMGYIKKRYF